MVQPKSAEIFRWSVEPISLIENKNKNKSTSGITMADNIMKLKDIEGNNVRLYLSNEESNWMISWD